MLREFINETYRPQDGEYVRLSDLCTKFHEWLIARGENPERWPTSRVKIELKLDYVLGHHGAAVWWLPTCTTRARRAAG